MAVAALAAAGLWWSGETPAPTPDPAGRPAVAPGRVDAAVPAQPPADRAGTAAVVASARPSSAASAWPALPTGDLQVPEPVDLRRAARDAREPVADAAPANASADLRHDRVTDAVDYRDAAGRPARAQLSNAVLAESDVGLRFYPGAQASPAGSSTVIDPAAGRTAVAAFTTADAPAQVVAFYRQQAQALASGQVEVTETTDTEAGPWQWQIVDRRTGVNRGVLVARSGHQVSVTLTRWQPPAATPRSGG